jgi:adenosylhomocysteine nucleosidase
LALAALALLFSAPSGAAPLDPRPLTAIMTAFAPEKAAMMALLGDKKVYRLHGAEIVTGTLEGHRVLLAESGVSMVNASMTAQSLIDRFKVERIVFSGIAGGIDPSLHVGDVVVPEEWAQPMESVMMRETPEGPKPPDWMAPELTDVAPFGVMKPKKVDVAETYHESFPADAALLAAARKVAASVSLKNCSSDRRCLDQPPKILVGGTGVSTQSFIDNAKLRGWLFEAWRARATDMESAAVAQVATINGVPFIAFRSLSDLAGGEENANRMDLFMTLAAENAASVVKAFVAELPRK